MTELYLIAHKVRGEPAFDIAIRMDCPHCHSTLEVETTDRDIACIECDSLGYWWIIPTSGHRAYPSWDKPLRDYLGDDINYSPPADLPDHYTTRAAPTRSLIDVLGLIHAPLARKAPIKRRL